MAGIRLFDIITVPGVTVSGRPGIKFDNLTPWDESGLPPRGGLEPLADSLLLPPNSPGPPRASHIAPGMLGDYYNRILFLPPTLTVQNPELGVPQNFSIWNAFLVDNQIETRTDSGATGLTNSALVGENFRAVQLKEFSVTIGQAAPAIIAAEFVYTFTEGGGTFRFNAVRATILQLEPEEPFQVSWEYRTDIFTARDGSEIRTSLRSNRPRQRVELDFVLQTDQERRELRQALFDNNLQQVIVPLWFEPFQIPGALNAGDVTLTGDFALSDIRVGENVYIQNSTTGVGEIASVSTATPTALTLESGLQTGYPAGSAVYPTVTVQPDDEQRLRYYAVNAFDRQFGGLAQEQRSLGGAGVPALTIHEGLPVLEQKPSANNLVEETFSSRAETADFGGITSTFKPQRYSNLVRPMQFYIDSRETFQYWKLFLDTVYGQRDLFFHPTFQPDLVVTGYTPGTAIVEVQADPDFRTWFASAGNKSLRFVSQPGNVVEYRLVSSINEIDEDTLQLILPVALADTGPGGFISEISLLHQVRLASDTVRLQHFSSFSRLNLATVTRED